MNEKQIALAALATGKDMGWVVQAYARDVTAAERAEAEAHQRRMAELWRDECAALLDWIDARLPGFAQRIGINHLDYDRVNDSPPFRPRLRVTIGRSEVVLTQDPRGIPGGNVVQISARHHRQISMPADEPDENWANFVITVADVTGAVEWAAVPAPGEVADQ